MTLIITLLILGIILVLIEIFVIPGTTVVGISGIAMLIAAIWMTFDLFGIAAGLYLLIATVVMMAIALRYAFRAKTWSRLSLAKNSDGRVDTFLPDSIHVGDTGVSISRIAPIGRARFNDNDYEVKSIRGYIDEKTTVVVTKIENNQIIIQPKTS